MTRVFPSLLLLLAFRLCQAVEYLQQAVAFDDKDGHTWEELAYCYLMINDLQNSYTAYQHALYHIQNPKVRVSDGRYSIRRAVLVSIRDPDTASESPACLKEGGV